MKQVKNTAIPIHITTVLVRMERWVDLPDTGPDKMSTHLRPIKIKTIHKPMVKPNEYTILLKSTVPRKCRPIFQK
jgi:hypothetical protein